MHPMLNTAIKAARRAGKVIVRHMGQIDRLTIESKGRNDFVSEVDRLAEAEILDTLQTAYPSHAILAEETGHQDGVARGAARTDEFRWIIDPLDGTTNFLHGYPQFSVSIALYHQNRPFQAVVFDPLRNELFTASRGGGCQINDHRVRVSGLVHLEPALLGTGFPYKTMEHLEVWIDTFRTLLPRVSGVRRAGSAALDLAHVACGRLDGFWEFGLNPWDMAAGALLIHEAGGLAMDFAGESNYLETGNIVAGTPKVAGEILRLIQPSLPANWRT